jgi:uncharacterized OB-fold protein
VSERLVDHSLFVSDAEEVTLRGGRCTACGTTAFPHQDACPRCGGVGVAPVALPRSGRLWSFTVQAFEPKSPYRGTFAPYGVGYVDLGPVIVETRLTVNDPERLAIGDGMHLTLVPAFRDGDTEVLTFAFAPAGEPS